MCTNVSLWDLWIINLYYWTQTLVCRPWLSPLLLWVTASFLPPPTSRPFWPRTSTQHLPPASCRSLDVVSVFSANPRDGSDAVGIPAAQWQFVKHRKSSDPSPTPNSRIRHVQSHFESSFFPPLEAPNFSEASSPRPHDQMHWVAAVWLARKKNGVNKQFTMAATKVATCPLVKRRPYCTKTNRGTEF